MKKIFLLGKVGQLGQQTVKISNNSQNTSIYTKINLNLLYFHVRDERANGRCTEGARKAVEAYGRLWKPTEGCGRLPPGRPAYVTGRSRSVVLRIFPVAVRGSEGRMITLRGVL